MAHTPGPWFWQVRERQKLVRLYTPKNGSCTVMDFVRLGMQSAQPRFSDRNGEPRGGIMIEATELDLDHHPDARLIAAAPTMYDYIARKAKEGDQEAIDILKTID